MVREKLGAHIDITKTATTTGKKVILKQVSPYRTDFYKCQDGKYRFVTIRYKDVYYNANSKKHYIKSEWYVSEMKKKSITDEDVFVCSLHHDELIGIVRNKGDKYCFDGSTERKGESRYHDGVHPEILKFTATNNDKSNKIEIKPIYTYCKKQLTHTISNVLQIKKYATDVMGNLYEVKDNVLKLEF